MSEYPEHQAGCHLIENGREFVTRDDAEQRDDDDVDARVWQQFRFSWRNFSREVENQNTPAYLYAC